MAILKRVTGGGKLIIRTKGGRGKSELDKMLLEFPEPGTRMTHSQLVTELIMTTLLKTYDERGRKIAVYPVTRFCEILGDSVEIRGVFLHTILPNGKKAGKIITGPKPSWFAKKSRFMDEIVVRRRR